MSEENKKRLFTITGARQVEGGVEFDFDLSDEFVEMFKKEQGLKKWSQKRFDAWVSENVDSLMIISGLAANPQEESE
tara:strand:+ start:138 stop:368 length:231 start_codon:yes stop_codon:yes gene_type:complete